MAKGDNPCIPLYDDGEHLTGAVITATITGGTFVKPSGFQSGPLLNAASPATDGGNIQIITCPAAGRAMGVAAYDGLVGDKIHIHSGANLVVPMLAGGTIAAGAEVESDAAGKPVVLASGRPNGICINAVTVGQTAYIRLY